MASQVLVGIRPHSTRHDATGRFHFLATLGMDYEAKTEARRIAVFSHGIGLACRQKVRRGKVAIGVDISP